jgi:hypothetical protein
MAAAYAATIVSGSYIRQQMPGFQVEIMQITSNDDEANAVTFRSKLGKIKEIFVTSNTAAKGGPYTAAWSGVNVSITADAGTTGDAALLSVMIVGF